MSNIAEQIKVKQNTYEMLQRALERIIQLYTDKSHFVYELLQNANDYPVEGKMVDVEFHITDNYLLFLHSGEKFNVRNISGICGINEKEKTANKKTIGYKGIGFKTVCSYN